MFASRQCSKQVVRYKVGLGLPFKRPAFVLEAIYNLRGKPGVEFGKQRL